jgi:NitT/TauT family transport system ATP-binding protein
MISPADADPNGARPGPSEGEIGAAPAEGASIEAIDLRVGYETADDDILAIESLNLNIAPGEFVAVIGPSGCGKSTLLKAICGLVPPTSGSVTVARRDPAWARSQRMFGFVFQEPVLLAWRTNIQNVTLPLEVIGVPREERVRRAAQALEKVGLSSFADRYPRQLSGGMRQRVAIARALCLEPQIMLMDEPFGALDELTRITLSNELQRIWIETQVTVVFVTHSIREAVFLADRVVVLSDRPARQLATLSIDIPRPRLLADRESDRYSAYAAQLGKHLGLSG